MKHKTWAILLIAVLLAAAVYAADPDGGKITSSVLTNTSVRIAITSHPDAVDSVFVCRIAIGGTDTIFVAQIDTVTTTSTITGEPPGLNAAYFLLVRQGAGGPSAISDKDTLQIYGPEIERDPSAREFHIAEKMIRAVSWRPYNVLDEFTVNGATSEDSSGVYSLWKNNSFVFTATQDGDSVKAMVYFSFGHRNMTQKGTTIGFTAYTDSLNITSGGTFRKTLTASTFF